MCRGARRCRSGCPSGASRRGRRGGLRGPGRGWGVGGECGGGAWRRGTLLHRAPHHPDPLLPALHPPFQGEEGDLTREIFVGAPLCGRPAACREKNRAPTQGRPYRKPLSPRQGWVEGRERGGWGSEGFHGSSRPSRSVMCVSTISLARPRFPARRAMAKRSRVSKQPPRCWEGGERGAGGAAGGG